MTDEEERFVVAPVGSTQRWVVHRPTDPYGDGYVHTMRVEVSDDGISANSQATFEGQGPENLLGFLGGLAAHWRGWQGTRSWTSMEGGMTLEASHDGTGHVRIAITVRDRPWYPDAWSARVVVTLEAGEELNQMAETASHILRPMSKGLDP